MKSLALWSLVILNVVLGGILLARFGRENTAIAQVGRPADCTMIPGEIIGNSNAVIFLIDTTNGKLGGMIFDPTRSRFDLLPPIDLARVLDAGAAGGVPVAPATPKKPGAR